MTLETLKEISNSEDVLEVGGEYTGAIGSWGPSHEHAGHRFLRSSIFGCNRHILTVIS
ncbi:MAG: hypothetical protein WAK17_23315 [Candidatus Nitrosopolaris sp.]